MVSVVSSTPTRGNLIFCWNFLKPLDVNSSLKCKIDLVVKNSIATPNLPVRLECLRWNTDITNVQLNNYDLKKKKRRASPLLISQEKINVAERSYQWIECALGSIHTE